jgi:hypothetical protein
MRPVPRRDGTTDFDAATDSFHDVFCHDMSSYHAALIAVTQRAAGREALVEPSCERPLWRDVPSWCPIGEEDGIIPAGLQRFMARP